MHRTDLLALAAAALFTLPAAGDVRSDVSMRPLALDVAQLQHSQPGDRLVVDLPDGDKVTILIAEVERPDSEHVIIRGSLQGELGRVTLVARGSAVTGLVESPERGTFRISGLEAGAHAISQLDLGALPPCADAVVPEADRQAEHPRAAAGADCDDGSTVDVVVLYTALARIDAADHGVDIESEIQLAAALTNEAYENSGVMLQLNVVHVAETDYNEDGTYFAHLSRLKNDFDGYMDEAHALRDIHRADLVSLVVADGTYCGIAYLLGSLSEYYERYGFSVSAWGCAATGMTFAHELGHNMGACHALGDGGGCESGGLFYYSNGHRFVGGSGTRWRTVMAYYPGSRIRHFSNPDVFFDGRATGVDDRNENARTLNASALLVSNYRCSTPQCLESKLTAPEPRSGDGFGAAAAAQGNVVVIGDPGVDDQGAAYVLELTGGTWEFVRKLESPDPGSTDSMGRAAAISGEWIIVGDEQADGRDIDSGKAYVFKRVGGTWIYQSTLIPDDGQRSDFFGKSVAIDGEFAIVGALGDDDAGENAGSAYVFRNTGGAWEQMAKLVPNGLEEVDALGASVAVGGTLVLIGAPNDDDRGSNAGAVYAYRLAGDMWLQNGKLTASDGGPSDFFGGAVAIRADAAVVGATGHGDKGAAYVFEYSDGQWGQLDELLPDDTTGNRSFGLSVAINAVHSVLVGDVWADGREADTGVATLFERNGDEWIDVVKLEAEDGRSGDWYGWAVALAGDLAVIGATGEGLNAGAAYVIQDVSACGSGDELEDCNDNGIPDDVDIQEGTSEDCNANGIPDECDLELRLSEDCNENGVPDECDIEDGSSKDINHNRVPDECDIDINRDGVVDFNDLLALLAAWGDCPGEEPGCLGDLDGDGVVAFGDLLIVLANWS